jgi:hypothetical protein
MRDEIYDREFQMARGELNRSIDSLLQDLRYLGQAFMEAFRSLHRVQFDAPWSRRSGNA